MEEKVSQQLHNQVNSLNMNTQSVLPSQDQHSRPHRSRARMILFIAFLIISHVMVLVILKLTILRARTPNYRLKSANLTNLGITNSSTSSSFMMNLNAEVTIKNKNFGPFKYDDCHMTIFYAGRSVGEVLLKKASVKTFSTKRFKISVNVTYSESSVSLDSNLSNDLASGILRMSSESEMRGQVEILKIHKKDKYPKMHCRMSIDLSEKIVRDLQCD